MFKEYKYSVIFIRHIKSFSRFLLLSTSNVRMSEGTFCRVEVHFVTHCLSTLKLFINANPQLIKPGIPSMGHRQTA